MEVLLDFLKEINSTIKALDSPIRRSILIYIEEAGRLSYSEIKDFLGISKGKLNYHLKILISSGMIRNYLIEDDSEYYSFYQVSKLGRDIVEGIFSAFRPSENELIMSASTTTINFFKMNSASAAYIERSLQDSAGPEEIQKVIPIYQEVKRWSK
jgi:DNA-binding Lrp family transcriptional regulator